MNGDGIGGTDNIRSLFGDCQPSAAGLPPQPEVISEIESLLADAKIGKLAGVVFAGFDPQGNYIVGTRGKVVYTAGVTALNELLFMLLATNFTQQQGWPGAPQR